MAGPLEGVPHAAVEVALTSAVVIPKTLAKNNETWLGARPASWAPTVTVTGPFDDPKAMDLMLLMPSFAFPLARVEANGAQVEQFESLAFFAHFWAIATAAASAPFRSWERSAYIMLTSTAMAAKPRSATSIIATITLTAPRSGVSAGFR